MMRLMRRDGTFEELPGAETADLEGEEVVFRDSVGSIVARYPKLEVTVMGISEEIVEAVEQQRDRQPD